MKSLPGAWLRVLAAWFAAPCRIVVVTLMIITTNAVAGVQSGAAQEPLLEAERVAKFARYVEMTLADKGARVAILARTGRPDDELPAGVRYTHVAFAVYSTIKLEDGSSRPGYVTYNLYQMADTPHVSHLVQDYPYGFFAGVPTLRAGIIVPVAEVQKRLLQTITSDRYQRMHNPVYSTIANPYNNQTQNCTEFTLNVLNAAIYQTDNMAMIKSVLRDHYSAMALNINPLKLLVGAATSREISLVDHPGNAETATFGTMDRYLSKFNLVKQTIHLTEQIGNPGEL